METGIVTSKGQVVIPAGIRHRHEIKKGTKICFIDRPDEIVLKPVTDEYINRVKGRLGTKGAALKELRQEKGRERQA
jgi:AbrB family looped-hinge helix DNA binding protein